MTSLHVVVRQSWFRRALLLALALGLLPVGTAFADPHVRITRDGTEIRLTQYGRSRVMMTAQQGDVFEVIHIDGDRYAHRRSNWYWVLLPPDLTGQRLAGWVRGDLLEHVPAPPPVRAPGPAASGVSPAPSDPLARAVQAPVQIAEAEQAGTTPSPPAAAATGSVAPAAVPDVVLHFAFDRSDLTDETRRRLDGAIAMLKTDAQSVSLLLEGHADGTGPEAYNQALGLARAETVRRYLSEQLQIPANRIGVVSHGEHNPVAPNTTSDGRALNRRVVIKAGR